MGKKYTVVDLFAGAGGLSYGFELTRHYEVKIAFENNPVMQKTYKKNHPEVEVKGDVCQADYEQIKAQFGQIDVVIGGPPCQGFSNANRQRSKAISVNNMLVKQYVRAINELQPSAFVMENVSMLKSDVHYFYLRKNDEDLKYLKAEKITLKPLILLESCFFFPEAIEIVKDRTVITDNLWPSKIYDSVNVVYKFRKNLHKMHRALNNHKNVLLKFLNACQGQKENTQIDNQNEIAFSALRAYYAGELQVEKLAEKIEYALQIQKMLKRALEVIENDLQVSTYDSKNGLVAVIPTYAVYDYLKDVLGTEQNDYVITDGVLSAAAFGAPQRRNRFIVMGIKREISEELSFPKVVFEEDRYRTVRDAIGDLEAVKPNVELQDDIDGIQLDPVQPKSDLGQALRDSKILRNHIITKTTEVAMARFRAIKEGENFHSLADDLKTNTYTDVERTQNTIYLRLKYDEPSDTVVNVRKSMWIHPVLDRAVSVREAARLQTFPDSYVFCGSKDKQYQQVGNAVPPSLAKAIAEQLTLYLDNTRTCEKSDG